jgi:hypothetical protein
MGSNKSCYHGPPKMPVALGLGLTATNISFVCFHNLAFRVFVFKFICLIYVTTLQLSGRYPGIELITQFFSKFKFIQSTTIMLGWRNPRI